MTGFWEGYEKAAQEESGGGGIVAVIRVDIGYKVYVAGVNQADAFFGVSSPDERNDAKAEAGTFAQENGAPRGAQWGIQLIARADEALSQGRPASWPKGDRFWNTDSWTSACKEVVVPSLRDNEIAPPWEGWARIGFKPDPYKVAMGEGGKTDTDQEGNPRYPQVAYIIETFANQEAAYGGVDVEADPADVAFPEENGELPDGVDPSFAAFWDQIVEDARKQSAEMNPKQIRDYLVENWDLTITTKDVIVMLK